MFKVNIGLIILNPGTILVILKILMIIKYLVVLLFEKIQIVNNLM